MTHPDREETFEVLHRRIGVLRAVSDEPRTIRDLVSALPTSRSTVYTATRELESVGLAECRDGRYRPTLFGCLLRRRYDRFAAGLDDLCGLQDVLAGLPRDLPVDPVAFTGATVVTADANRPERPVNAVASFIQDSDRIASATPVTRARYRTMATDAVVEGDLTVELVVESGIVEHMISEHPDLLADLLRSESLTMCELDGRLPFGLVLRKRPSRAAGIALYDRGRRLRAFVSSSAPPAWEWARERYEAWRRETTALEPAQIEAG